MKIDFGVWVLVDAEWIELSQSPGSSLFFVSWLLFVEEMVESPGLKWVVLFLASGGNMMGERT